MTHTVTMPPAWMDSERLDLSRQLHDAAEIMDLEASLWDLLVTALDGRTIARVTPTAARTAADSLHRTARHVAEIARAALGPLETDVSDAYLWAAAKIHRDAQSHRRMLNEVMLHGRART